MKNADVFINLTKPIRNLFAEGRKINYLARISNASNAAWLTRDLNGEIRVGHSVCFGSTAGNKFTNFASIIGPKFNSIYTNEKDKKEARKYLNYVFKRSIFSRYYKNTNVSDALKYGFEIDCHNAPRSLMLCALAAVRSCWERRSMQGFSVLRRLGFDEHRAFLLSAYIKHTGKDDKWYVYGESHAHTVFTNLSNIDIKRVLDNQPRNMGAGPISKSERWDGAHAQFAAAGRRNCINVHDIETSLTAHRKTIEINYGRYHCYDFSKPEVARAFFEAYNNAITNAYNEA